MKKKTIENIDARGRRVLVRVDFNIPIEQGVQYLASYDHRLRSTLPTIRYLIGQNSKIVLCSHLGRPKGKVVEELRMAPVAKRLSELLSRPVRCLSNCVGPEVEAAITEMAAGEIIMLENLRFHPGEEKNDPEFSRQLASLGEWFVMDAFSVAHRAHASTVGVPRYVTSVMGLLTLKETEFMGRALESPDRPLGAVLGGAKASDKLLVLENLIDTVDRLFVGGGMAATFLKAQGHPTGASRVEEDRLELVSSLMARARDKGVSLQTPKDVVVSPQFAPDSSNVVTVPVEAVPDGWYIMDIGAGTAAEFTEGLGGCGTVIWNGPMGVFEFAPFSEGTRRVAEALASLEATTVVGGGSTAEAVEALGFGDRMTHVSAGGGASLKFLEGAELPGIAALEDRVSVSGATAIGM